VRRTVGRWTEIKRTTSAGRPIRCRRNVTMKQEDDNIEEAISDLNLTCAWALMQE
jgi:hypothetical protein